MSNLLAQAINCDDGDVAAMMGFVGASDFGLTTTTRPVATSPDARLVGVG